MYAFTSLHITVPFLFEKEYAEVYVYIYYWTVDRCCGWYGLKFTEGGLASSVNREELAEKIHCWPRPWCIIVHSDPGNILNHQSKQSDPPVNTQGEALHNTLLYCSLGSPALAAPLNLPHTYGSGLTNSSGVAALLRMWDQPHTAIILKCWVLNNKVTGSQFMYLSVHLLHLEPCKTKAGRTEEKIWLPFALIVTEFMCEYNKKKSPNLKLQKWRESLAHH